MNAPGPYWWSVNIGSGNGLVPSGSKPLPDPAHAHQFRSTSERSGAHMYHLFIDEIVEN